MVQRSYPGITNPEEAFQELAPLVRRLRDLQHACRPFGRDYHAIAVALQALDTTAYHFTRRPHFYGSSGSHQ